MTAAPSFRVKNLDRFQHYKNRAPVWIKLYNELLDDYEFAALPDATKIHLVLIWLLASRADNLLPFDANWIARRINAHDPVDLDLLLARGFIVACRSLAGCYQVASKMLAHFDNPASAEREERESRGEIEGEGETERAAKRGAVLPDNWYPSQSDFDYGYEKGFAPGEVHDLAEDMRLWAGANAGRQVARKSNWSQAFKGWINREAKRRKQNGNGPSLKSVVDQIGDAATSADPAACGEGGSPPLRLISGGKAERS